MSCKSRPPQRATYIARCLSSSELSLRRLASPGRQIKLLISVSYAQSQTCSIASTGSPRATIRSAAPLLPTPQGFPTAVYTAC